MYCIHVQLRNDYMHVDTCVNLCILLLNQNGNAESEEGRRSDDEEIARGVEVNVLPVREAHGEDET